MRRRNTPTVVIVCPEDCSKANLFWDKVDGTEADVKEAKDDDEEAESSEKISLHKINDKGAVLTTFEKPFKRASLTSEHL